MGERDPRVDPRRGDVFRWTYDDWGVTTVCVAHGNDMYTCTIFDKGGVDVEIYGMLPAEWADWSDVDGGIDGVQVLHRAEAPQAMEVGHG